MMTLVVANTPIRQDHQQLFCLNDLHRAAGGEKKNGPAYFLGTPETKGLIDEIKSENTGRPVFVTKRGIGGGTFACDDLVYAYAMWISPKFCLRVIRAYKASAGKERQQHLSLMHQRIALEARDSNSFAKASLGAKFMVLRRHELPSIKKERAELEVVMQQSLFATAQTEAA